MGRHLIIQFFLLSLFVASSVYAEEGSSRLQEVNAEIESLQKTVDELQAKRTLAEGELKKIQTTTKSVVDRAGRIKKDLGKVNASKAEAENLLKEIQEKMRIIEAISEKRLRALYMLKGEGIAASIPQLKQAADFDKASVYLTHIRASDQQLVEDLKLLRGKRDTETGKLTTLHRQQSELLAQLELQRQELEVQAKARQAVLTELQAQRKEHDSALVALKAQALRLETVVRSLTGGDEDEGEASKPAEKVKMLGFEGLGLGDKSLLTIPFKGKLLQRFGKQKGKEGLMKKGVEFGGAGPVQAASEGRVAYVGRMPHVGSVIIIDHGKRDYTLYGRLSNPAVTVGQNIAQGETVGEADLPDEAGRTFYFEVRRAGAPVDPQVVFGGKLGQK